MIDDCYHAEHLRASIYYNIIGHDRYQKHAEQLVWKNLNNISLYSDGIYQLLLVLICNKEAKFISILH